ncbi:MAG TPA: trigger factor [Campylobacterales bacterium]|nr:trigger factor [Campylobacterales bacterium]
MKIEAIKIDSANAEIKAVIPASLIEENETKIAKQAAKTMDIAGFRKGKVPVHIVKARYGSKLVEDAKNDAVRSVYESGLKDLSIDTSTLIGEPTVEKFDEKDGEIELVIAIATKPEIKIDGYKELIPEIETPEVSDEDIKQKINTMLKGLTLPSRVEEARELKKGDTALFDFEGFVDGEAFEGGSAKGHQLEIGSGNFIPGFEDGMTGMKVGDEKDVKVTFPAEYGAKNLAGKDAIFKVKLLEIQEIVISDDIDSDTLKKLLPNEKEATVEMLNERVKQQLVAEKLAPIYHDDIKPKYVDALLSKFDIDLPKTIVEQEMDLSMRKVLQEMKEEEIKEFSTDLEAYKTKREEFREDAVNSVKITFLVDELAKAEEVVVDDQAVMQTLYYEAIQMGQNPQEMLKQYEDQGLLPAVKMAIVEDRLFNKLFNDKRESK